MENLPAKNSSNDMTIDGLNILIIVYILGSDFEKIFPNHCFIFITVA